MEALNLGTPREDDRELKLGLAEIPRACGFGRRCAWKLDLLGGGEPAGVGWFESLSSHMAGRGREVPHLKW